MTALLIGLLMVAAGAGGTWLALFGINPARAWSRQDSRPELTSEPTDILPSLGLASASTTAASTTTSPVSTTMAAPVPGSATTDPSAPRPEARVAQSSSDVAISPLRRLRSAFLLAGIALAIAAIIGAVTSAAVVVVVMLFG